jgi:hypothetical protein
MDDIGLFAQLDSLVAWIAVTGLVVVLVLWDDTGQLERTPFRRRGK